MRTRIDGRSVQVSNDAIWNMVPDGLVLTTRGTVVAANASAEQMFGYQQRQLVDLPTEALLPSNFEGRRRDGSLFPVRLSVAPLEPPDNGTLAVVRDVSEIVRWKVAAAAATDEVARLDANQGWLDHQRDTARESITQHLFAAGLALQLCLRDVDYSPSREQLERAIGVIDTLINDLNDGQPTRGLT